MEDLKNFNSKYRAIHDVIYTVSYSLYQLNHLQWTACMSIPHIVNFFWISCPQMLKNGRYVTSSIVCLIWSQTYAVIPLATNSVISVASLSSFWCKSFSMVLVICSNFSLCTPSPPYSTLFCYRWIKNVKYYKCRCNMNSWKVNKMKPCIYRHPPRVNKVTCIS